MSQSIRQIFFDTLSYLTPTSVFPTRPTPPSFKLLELPNEILLEIIDLLAENYETEPSSGSPFQQTPPTLNLQPLLALSRTNRHLRNLTLPCVFRSFRLSPQLNSTSSRIPALDFLAANPTIAQSHIRVLHIPWWPAAADTNPEDLSEDDATSDTLPNNATPKIQPQHRANADLLASVITNMRALRELRVGGSVQGLRECWEPCTPATTTPTPTPTPTSDSVSESTPSRSSQQPSFPQIRKLVLAAETEWLLTHCPRARCIVPDLWADARMQMRFRDASEEKWGPPEDLVRAAGAAERLERVEMTGWWDAGMLGLVAEAVPRLTELAMEHRSGLRVLMDAAVRAPLGRLPALQRVEVSTSAATAAEGVGRARIAGSMNVREAERLVKEVFGAIAGLKTLEAAGTLRADLVETADGEDRIVAGILQVSGQSLPFKVSVPAS